MASLMLSQKEEILAKIANHPWIHTIDLGHGVTTPGMWRASDQQHIMRAIDRVDFGGKKVLDIGCLDGLFTFEAERRGASRVYATDLVSQVYPPRDTTFQVAHKIKKSKSTYHPDVSVFDVGKLKVKDFDVVLFLGVYYHLRDPLLAIARLRQVMKDGALMVIEGEVFPEVEDASAQFYYRRHFAFDRSNWWVPSIPCLREWVESSFFQIVEEIPAPETYCHRNGPHQLNGRHTLIARAVSRKDRNWSFPDPELKKFDLTDYAADPTNETSELPS